MSRHAFVKWAQRSDKIYITVELPDAKDVKLKLEPEGKFSSSAIKDDALTRLSLNFLIKVNVEKVEQKWWSWLVKQERKPPVFLKVDWDKWADEGDENDGGSLNFDNMDFSLTIFSEAAKIKEAKVVKKPKKGMMQNLVHQLPRRLTLDCLGR
ncbi:hypothetical protein P3X46_001688 [Hevea brasiliensis]|uniref:Co-chaperone protein p23 n=1 Tax=Hevea brasiliensis TaxID=3981 RepID=A0ABQ9NH35_HEVBR|nr:hypothetical protein P3X46_001688 [Hevea brasiliensis]